jgi:hypothetical protein
MALQICLKKHDNVFPGSVNLDKYFFRDIFFGTWLIQSLCEVFMEKCCDHELHELLSMVGQRLREFESPSGGKQSYSYEVRHMYKKLYFNPGLPELVNKMN